MAEAHDGLDVRAELRHAINNRLNALSMQAELGLHFIEAGSSEAAGEALGKIVADCKRYSAELSQLLAD
jgi:hypothetical protein